MAAHPPSTLAAYVARHIGRKIIESELKPGERIQEEKVAAELGISRSPVREALRLLEKNRVVELIPRRGARVTEMPEAFIDWVWDILTELYALGARRFAEQRSGEDLRSLFQAVRVMRNCARKGDLPGYNDGVLQYASAGRRGSGNLLLEQILKELDPTFRRVLAVSVSLQKEDLIRHTMYFERIARFCEQGDGRKAGEGVREYFRNELEFTKKGFLSNKEQSGKSLSEGAGRKAPRSGKKEKRRRVAKSR